MMPLTNAAMSGVVAVPVPSSRDLYLPAVGCASRRAALTGGASLAAIATPIESMRRAFAACTAAAGRCSNSIPAAKSTILRTILSTTSTSLGFQADGSSRRSAIHRAAPSNAPSSSSWGATS